MLSDEPIHNFGIKRDGVSSTSSSSSSSSARRIPHPRSRPDFIGIFYFCSRLQLHSVHNFFAGVRVSKSKSTYCSSSPEDRLQCAWLRNHTHTARRIGAEWVWKDRLMYVCRPILLHWIPTIYMYYCSVCLHRICVVHILYYIAYIILWMCRCAHSEEKPTQQPH